METVEGSTRVLSNRREIANISAILSYNTSDPLRIL